MAKKRQASTLYRIQSGDCLFSIARQVLGDGNRYPEIKALNGMTTTLVLGNAFDKEYWSPQGIPQDGRNGKIFVSYQW